MRVLILFMLLLTGILFVPTSIDGDFYHHLHTGKYILQTHAFPVVDEWTFTASGKPWIAYSWLTGVVYELIYTKTGLSGIFVFNSVIGIFISLGLYLYFKKNHLTEVHAVLATILMSAIISLRFPMRPEVLQYLYIILILLISKTRFLYVTPIIILFWTNTYGASVLVGVFLIFFLQRFRLSSFLSLAAAFIHPYTSMSVLYFFTIAPIRNIQGEWAGLIDILLHAPAQLVTMLRFQILSWLTLTAMVVIAWWKQKKYTLSFFVFLPLYSFRLLPISALLSVPVLSKYFSAINSKFFIVLTMFFLILNFLSHSKELPTNTHEQLLVEFIKKYELYGNTFANQQLAAHLSYELFPKSRVYIDTRDDLFLKTPILGEYLSFLNGSTNIITLLSRHDIDVVAVDFVIDGPIYRPLFYSPQWTPVYLQDRYLIAIHSRAAEEKNIRRISTIDPYDTIHTP